MSIVSRAVFHPTSDCQSIQSSTLPLARYLAWISRQGLCCQSEWRSGHVRPNQPELIGRHVGGFRASLYATSDYLDRAGRPRTPREVADHDFVGNPHPERLIAPLQDQGIAVRPENFVVTSDNGGVVWELLKAGLGISMLPDALCESEPGLEKVLPDLPSPQFPVWLVTHREVQTSQRIRIVFDLLVRGLADVIRRGQMTASAGRIPQRHT